MQTSNHRITSQTSPGLPETVETLLSALLGCGLVLMLAFFLSLESWVLTALGGQ